MIFEFIFLIVSMYSNFAIDIQAVKYNKKYLKIKIVQIKENHERQKKTNLHLLEQ